MFTGSNDTVLAFLIIFLGGTGAEAAKVFRLLLDRVRGKPLPLTTASIDTDPATVSAGDVSIPIAMTPGKLRALQANPGLFGGEVAMILNRFADLLDPEDFANGSRTTRALTQLSFIVHLDFILARLQGAILGLMGQSGAGSILPVFVGSSGGGAGSALQILLARALRNLDLRARLLGPLPNEVLLTPISLVADPFAHALGVSEAQADRILANAYAFRLESAELEREHALKCVFQIGFSNHAGVVLDSRDEVAKMLGTTVYQCVRNWAEINARLVDIYPDRRYLGTDTLEFQRPATATNGAAH